MKLLIEQPFPFQKTLLIALIGALIGQSIVLIINWLKTKVDLSTKKQMIIKDLENQDKTLDLIIEKFNELNNLFIKRKTEYFKTSVFQNLQLDIYQSISKNELYLIFKKDLATLIDIYKSLEFIKNNSPYFLYKEYLEKSNLHLEEKKNEPNHEFYCDIHLGIIELSVQNIENHLKTIRETKLKIKN